MTKYIVTKKEQWLQRVEVDAFNENDAIVSALEGDGTIVADPQYDSDIASSSWKVEETE